MIDFLVIAAVFVGGFVVGAGWMWRIFDRVLGEYEQPDERKGGTLSYRVARLVR